MKRNTYAAVSAVLGAVIGVLATLIVFTFVNRQKTFDGDYNRWRKLNLILQQVQENYVDTVDVKALTDAAVTAALGKLDPHSVYLPPVELEASETELSGNFEGIGIQFNVPNDTAIVLSVIPGGPSEKAGLQQGDRIIRVDSRDIAGQKTPQDSMVRLMKGPAGTKVTVTVDRAGEKIPFDITRDKIPVHCVDAAFMLDSTTGYIRLTKFTRTTYSEFISAAIKLKAQGMTHLIFDLRENTGGYLDQAYLLCNEFLEKGDKVVYMEGLHRSRSDLDADGRGSLKDIQLSVLIDEVSASSSEIFAGAMQDNDRGVIVGRRSFGKGLVQEPINFTDGSGVRLTVARFYTPSGRCIQKPYSDHYAYDIYERYTRGELTSADSIKVNTDEVYYTKSGRRVYGGGGIVPDVFVPMDTTRASNFYIQCNKKAVAIRFASAVFDRYRSELSQIEDFASLQSWLDSHKMDQQFLKYAAKQGLKPEPGEWEETSSYMMPQVNALVGRYSKLGEEAFYRLWIVVDKTVEEARKPHELF